MRNKSDERRAKVVHHRLELERLPSGIWDMQRPPRAVQLWGKIPPGPWVAIVGTRTPSPEGQETAFQLARELAGAGVAIVSGGALGIDTAAHLGALAGGGQTLVVAPVWWKRAYPVNNRKLFDTIVRRGGGYLSVADENAPPFKWVFFRRNEALVAMSNLVVLGECPIASGAKNAMMHARRLGRPRYVLPFAFNEERAAGSHQEIVTEKGEILLNSDAILRCLDECGSFANPVWWERAEGERQRESGASGLIRSPVEGESKQSLQSVRARGSQLKSSSQKRAVEQREFAVVAQAVLTALSQGATNVENICVRTSLPPAVVQHQVLLLTLEGLVFEDSVGLLRYQPASNERL